MSHSKRPRSDEHQPNDEEDNAQHSTKHHSSASSSFSSPQQQQRLYHRAPTMLGGSHLFASKVVVDDTQGDARSGATFSSAWRVAPPPTFPLTPEDASLSPTLEGASSSSSNAPYHHPRPSALPPSPSRLRIFLVRHGESEANVDLSVYRTKPDHAIELTERGKQMARDAGRALRAHLLSSITSDVGVDGQQQLHCRMLVSPYERTRQTAQEILKVLNEVPESIAEGNDSPMSSSVPSASPPAPPSSTSRRIKLVQSVKECCYLAEQDFGLTEGEGTIGREKYSEELQRIGRQRQFRGKFWSRFPHGESPFDVTIRMGGVVQEILSGASFETATRGRVQTYILVSHGLTIRAFLAAWCHFSPEWISESVNPPNCSIQLVEQTAYQGYVFGGFERGKRVDVAAIEVADDPRQQAWDHYL